MPRYLVASPAYLNKHGRPKPRRPSLRLREIYDSLTGAWSREFHNGTLHAVTFAARLRRINRVVVRRARCETLQVHPKYRLRMFLIQADVRFRRLVEVIGIRPVMHDPEVLIGAAGIIARPSDGGRILVGQFELRA